MSVQFPSCFSRTHEEMKPEQDRGCLHSAAQLMAESFALWKLSFDQKLDFVLKLLLR